MKKTILQNLPNLLWSRMTIDVDSDSATPLRLLAPPTPPSGDNPWPVLLSFVDGDIAVRDLAIQIVGAEPTRGWNVPGFFPIKAIPPLYWSWAAELTLRFSGRAVQCARAE